MKSVALVGELGDEEAVGGASGGLSEHVCPSLSIVVFSCLVSVFKV